MTDAVVGRVVVAVDAASDAASWERESRFSELLTAEWIAALLEECLAELPALDVPLLVDRLEVDMGQVLLDAGPDEVFQQAKAAVKDHLRALFDEAWQRPADEGGARGPDDTALRAVEMFLRFGIADWTAGPGVTAAGLVQAAFDTNAGRTASLLRSVLRDPAAARRLADHLPPAMVPLVIQAIAPAAGDALLAAARLLTALHDARPLAAGPSAAVRAAATAAALAAAVQTGTAAPQHRALAQVFLGSVAVYLGLDPEALVRGAAARIRAQSGQTDPGALAQGVPADHPVAAAILQLENAENARTEDRAPPVDPAFAEALGDYLASGAIGAGRTGGQAISEGMLRRALAAWSSGGSGSAAARAAVVAKLADRHDRAAVTGRLHGLLPPREAEQAATWLDLSALSQPDSATGKTESETALFWFLLEYGALPWWGRDLASAPIDQWMADLVSRRAGDLASALLEMPEHRRAALVERMALRLAPGLSVLIAAAVNPDARHEMQVWLSLAPTIAAEAAALGAVGSDAGEDNGVTGLAGPDNDAVRRQGVAEFLYGPAGMDGGGRRAPPSADRVSHVLTAVLLGRLFDRQAPRLDWPTLRAALIAAAARRLGLDAQMLERVTGSMAGDGQVAGDRASGSLSEVYAGPSRTDELPLPNRFFGEEGGNGEATEPAFGEADLALIERFVSPAAQYAVPIEQVVAVLADAGRRSALARRMTDLEVDALAGRLSAEGSLLRVHVLGSLGPAVAEVLPLVSADRWRQAVAGRLVDILGQVVTGGTGRAVSAEGLLAGLLHQLSVRYRRSPGELARAVIQEARRHSSADPGALALLDDLYGQAEEADTATSGEAERTIDTGNPDGLQVLALVERFLGQARGGLAWQQEAVAVRRLLAEPRNRQVLASRLAVAQLDDLTESLSTDDWYFPPGAVPALASSIATLSAVTVPPDWVKAATADILGDLVRDQGDAAASPVSRLSAWLMQLTGGGGPRYASLVLALAESNRRTGGLPDSAARALERLAVSVGAANVPSPAGPEAAEQAEHSPPEADAPGTPEAANAGPGAQGPPPVHAPAAGPVAETPVGGATAAPWESAAGDDTDHGTADGGMVRRLGLPAEDQADEPALLAGFLAVPADTPQWRRRAAHLQRLLADPLRREVLAARMPSAELDLLVVRLGYADRILQPTAIAPLGALIAGIIPGAGSPGWVQGAIASVLAGLAQDGGAAAGALSQLRYLLIRLARDEGYEYAPLAQSLADAARGIGSLPPEVRTMLQVLAGTALADAPVAPAAPTVPEHPASTPSPDPEAEALPGGDEQQAEAVGKPVSNQSLEAATNQDVTAASTSLEPNAPADAVEPDMGSSDPASGVDSGPPDDDRVEPDELGVTRNAAASEAANQPDSDSPTGDLIVRLLAGDARVGEAVRERLGETVERLRLSNALSHTELDRLARRLLPGTSGYWASDIVKLGPLVTAIVPALTSRVWRQLVVQRLLAAMAVQPPQPAAAVYDGLLRRAVSTAAAIGGIPARALSVRIQDVARSGGAALPVALDAAIGGLAQPVPLTAPAAERGSAGGDDGAAPEEVEGSSAELEDARRFLMAEPDDPGFEASGPGFWTLVDNIREQVLPAADRARLSRNLAVAVAAAGGIDVLTGRFTGEELERLLDALAAGFPSISRHRVFTLTGVTQLVDASRPDATDTTEAPQAADITDAGDAAGPSVRRMVAKAAIAQTMARASWPEPARATVSAADILTDTAIAALQEIAEQSDRPLPAVLQEAAAFSRRAPGPEASQIHETLEALAGEQGEQGEQATGLPNDIGQSHEADSWAWNTGDDAGPGMPRDLIFVNDAGVVLLWPFLTHYFDRVGLLEDGQFSSEEAAARGVMLIHYMATTKTETEELWLTLPKLLCGVPFARPVTPRIELTEMEETVSEELLNVVCQNWPPLRNSSVEALRETFLLREGSLSWLEEQMWVLNVTAKPFDMLLGQLPWTLSTFKTPLMEFPMMVQWGGGNE